MKRLVLASTGVKLCCVDFGGEGQSALLLHGLCGRGLEWLTTARWLREAWRVYALDQRGHGDSDRCVADLSRAAFVGDVIAVIEELSLAPVLLLGQSLGGLNALLVAASRPELVRALVVVEVSGRRNPDAADNVRRWLAGWPVPFATLPEATAFFGGDTLPARTWARMLEKRDDGYWPAFGMDEMVASLADFGVCDYTAAWEKIASPTLLVYGENGDVTATEAEELRRRNTRIAVACIPDAGHDLHLEQPQAWHRAVESFLANVRARRDS